MPTDVGYDPSYNHRDVALQNARGVIQAANSWYATFKPVSVNTAVSVSTDVPDSGSSTSGSYVSK